MGRIDVRDALQMTILLIVAILVIIAGAFIFKLLWGSLSVPKDLTTLVNALQPVDPKSLAQLACQEDDTLLKRSLPPPKYRALKKQRLLVLRAYYRTALKNCSVLQACGAALQQGKDLESRDFGTQLAGASLTLRVRLLQAITLVQISAWFPAFEIDIAQVSKAYAATAKELRTLSWSRPDSLQKLVEQAFSS